MKATSGTEVTIARLYMDHDIARVLADLLRARGYDVVTTRERGMEQARDYEQLLLAARERRVLVTHNGSDFLLLNGAWQHWSQAWQVTPHHSGILVIPQQPRLSPAQAADEVHRFLLARRPLDNQLYQWQVGRGWRLRQ